MQKIAKSVQNYSKYNSQIFAGNIDKFAGNFRHCRQSFFYRQIAGKSHVYVQRFLRTNENIFLHVKWASQINFTIHVNGIYSDVESTQCTIFFKAFESGLSIHQALLWNGPKKGGHLRHLVIFDRSHYSCPS